MELTGEHIDRSLAIIRDQSNPQRAWDEVISFCNSSIASSLWASLPRPDLVKDTQEAALWLSRQAFPSADTTGIYLGLDTLNMREGNGMNVGIGVTSKCDVAKEETEWAYNDLNYGTDHLIYGLHPLHKVYSKPEWQDLFSFADYILFLTYSGIVLGQALSQLQTKQSFLAVWGFHDGDLFVLGRKTPERFELIYR